MPELAFHFGAADTLAYTCRLLRKAVASGARVVVRSDAATAQRLDADLWSVSPTDFVAHCQPDASAAVLQRSPVLLAGPDAYQVKGYPVLVNLADDVPQGIDAFERVIEVVGKDETQRECARARWKWYKAQGLAIQRHDLTGRAAG